MNQVRLVRIVPTGPVELPSGEVIEGSEAHIVEPLSEEQIIQIAKQFGMEGKFSERAFAHAIEKEHGIGRRLDA